MNETKTQTNAQALAVKYRLLADWLEAHPDFPVYEWETPSLQVFASSAKREGETEKEFMARAARAVGKARKVYGESYFDLVADTPEGIHVEVSASREATCVRKQVGVEMVTVPARPAQPEVAEHVKEVPVYEWDCSGILDADAEGRA